MGRVKAHIEMAKIEREALATGEPSTLDVDQKTLHIRCGSDIKESLARAGFVGDFLDWLDLYVLGSVPQTDSLEEFLRVRAQVIVDQGWDSFGSALKRFTEDYAELDQAKNYDQVMLWFEHDSHDILIMAMLLDFFSDREKRPVSLKLICVTDVPGVEIFNGIGQLPPEALRVIWKQFEEVNFGQFDLGQKVWAAIKNPDPTALYQIIKTETPALPPMAKALQRHLQELPSTHNGLSLTEELTLKILSEKGAMNAARLFGQYTNNNLVKKDLAPYWIKSFSIIWVIEPDLSILTKLPRDFSRNIISNWLVAIINEENLLNMLFFSSFIMTKLRKKIAQFFIVILLPLPVCSISFAEEVASSDTKNVEQEKEVTIAPNIDLKDVAPPPEPVIQPPQEETETKPAIIDDKSDTREESTKADLKEKPIPVKIEPPIGELVILGSEVLPGTSARLAWSPHVTISGLSIPTPVLVIKGKKIGPVVCITAATHGDELNGIEVIRRVLYDIDSKKLSGTLIGVPIVNLQGFQRGSRYLPDRRDLNRFFPGDPNGSLASRIANSLFTEVISHCDYLIDIHTGSFRRTNLAQIRANMSNEKVVDFVEGFDKIAVVHHKGNPGMLRTAANDKGIVAITMELGESLRIQEKQIAAGVHSINSILDKLGMYSRKFVWGKAEPAYYESLWLRVENGGLLFSQKIIGDKVRQGDVLGAVIDPITNQKIELTSPVNGSIIGMAVNQVVVPGFAAYHIGVASTQEEMAKVSEEEAGQLEETIVDGELID